jgi:para-aminobenzoate synthetase
MGKTLLIDNYDSFTYNLYALIAETSGQTPVVVRNDAAEWAALRTYDIDRIVVSPGPGRPQRRADLGLSAEAILSSDLPVLGVCLGHQAIGLLCGGSVDLAVEPVHGRRSEVRHIGMDLFEGIPSPFQAVRYHSLAVTDLATDLQPLAWADDGTLMALRHRSRPLWGVQFHPESIRTEHGATLMKRYFELSERRCSVTVPEIETRQPAAPAPSSLRIHAFRADVPVGANEVFTKLYADSDPVFWLDSVSMVGDGGRFSYMGDATGPLAEVVCYHSEEHRLEVDRHGQRTILEHVDVFSYLQTQLAQRRVVDDSVHFGFMTGYVGYFGYELKGELQGQHAAPAATPDACWIFADRVIAFDREDPHPWLLCLDDAVGLSPRNRAWIEHMQSALRAVAVDRRPTGTLGSKPQGSCKLQWRHSPEHYRELIGSALHSIRQGESYEICLTNQLTGICTAEPLAIYQELRQINPAPYGAFLKIGSLSVLCSSPELFLKFSAQGEVESKPIKGTAPRAADPLEDQRLAGELAQSVKNMAENLMIVDLLRNDLNQVCNVGSVHVPHIFAVEGHSSVHQLVSTIRGQLRASVTPVDCVRAAFPGGSMTGAPKIRTMAILDALERGPRGVYSGSLGYFSVNDSVKLNIVIRTMVIDAGRISMGTGGAITALSDPDEEFAEILLKVRPLLRALKRCSEHVEVQIDAPADCPEPLLDMLGS